MKIKNLRLWKSGEWHWNVINEENGSTKHYWTNRHGEGIFHEHAPNDHRQDTGTCQFSLNTVTTLSGARKKLKRYFE
jgi:hypothetical protein